MTCDGCRSKVEKALNTIDGVEAKVSLNPAIATLTMEKHIATTQLQKALSGAGKYTIEVSKNSQANNTVVNTPVPKSCCANPTHNDKKVSEIKGNSKGNYY